MESFSRPAVAPKYAVAPSSLTDAASTSSDGGTDDSFLSAISAIDTAGSPSTVTVREGASGSTAFWEGTARIPSLRVPVSSANGRRRSSVLETVLLDPQAVTSTIDVVAASCAVDGAAATGTSRAATNASPDSYEGADEDPELYLGVVMDDEEDEAHKLHQQHDPTELLDLEMLIEATMKMVHESIPPT